MFPPTSVAVNPPFQVETHKICEGNWFIGESVRLGLCCWGRSHPSCSTLQPLVIGGGLFHPGQTLANWKQPAVPDPRGSGREGRILQNTMSRFRFVLSRLALTKGSFRLNDNIVYRPLPLVNGICRGPLYEKLNGARCFSSSDTSSHIVLTMPALSPTMNQGNIARWRKKEGDKIDVGDVICEIETDKATLEFESLEEGFLAKIITPEGSKDVIVGQPIAITVEDPEDIKNVAASAFSNPEIKEEKSAAVKLPEKQNSDKGTVSRISPSAKLLIAEFGLDASSIKASGPHGTLLKGDVLAVIKSRGGSTKTGERLAEKTSATPQSSKVDSRPTLPQSSNYPQPKDSYDDLPNNQIRKVIAKRLLESKQGTPHLYLSSDVILDPLLAFRNVLKEQHNVKVSINDIIIKAVALALRNVPEANAYWNNEKGEASLCDSVDVSIAVATDKGLMTPIVRNADQKSLSAMSLEVKELAEKARTGKLIPSEYQGGTFSISNLGMFPVDHFCAIINPPQACILAVGRGNRVVEPVVGNDGTEKPAVVTKMNLNLSADHRVFDGEIGGKFLSALAQNLSDVQRLLL